VINPELIISKLFTERLDDDEALIIIGCEQFSSYTGYASTFKFAGDFIDATPLDVYRRRKCRVVAIDALSYRNQHDQFKEATLRRELNKAYVGFFRDSGNDQAPVATGLWGAGAFNGHTVKTALIQLMACSVIQRNLVFYTFGDEKTKYEVAEIFKFLIDKKISVGKVFRLLKKFEPGSSDDSSLLIKFIVKECEKVEVKPALMTSFFAPKIKMRNESEIPDEIEEIAKDFSVPKLKVPLPEKKNEEEKIWGWGKDKRVSTSGEVTKEKKKWMSFESTFGSSSSSKAPQSKIEPPKPSLLEYLDKDMEKSGSKH
jgi:poly(ADP-ribose) glycohydrolase